MLRNLTTLLTCGALVIPQVGALAQSTPPDASSSRQAPSNWGGSGNSGNNNNSNWGGSGGSNNNNNNNNNNWNNSGGSGQLTCESWNYQYRRCPANTGNNVQLTRRIAGNCNEGRTWGYDRNAIWVDGGCRAQFRFGSGNNNNNNNNNSGNWGRGYAGTQRCESWNYAFRRCSANTNGRVDLLRTLAGTCQRGRSWGFDNGGIWVNHGCRGEFGFGYGNNNGNNSNSSNTGEVVAGVALAAGLIALLAASSNSGKSSSTATPPVNASAPPATIVANLSAIPADRRPSVQTCLDEAARQIGATGGTQISLDRVTSLTRTGDGWELRAQLITSYPDESRTVSLTCRADGQQLLAIDFGS